MLKLIGQFFQVVSFFVGYWREKDEVKSAKKKAVAAKITNAFESTDKEERASRLSAAITNIKRL